VIFADLAKAQPKQRFLNFYACSASYFMFYDNHSEIYCTSVIPHWGRGGLVVVMVVVVVVPQDHDTSVIPQCDVVVN